MSEIIIKNGQILTMDEDRNKIERGDLKIVDDKIVDIGGDLGFDGEVIIDAEDKAVLPGLVNAHTHLAMVLFRGIGDDLKLQEWLQDVIWPREGVLCSSDVRNGALLGCLELIMSGTTCFADQYFFMDEVAKVVGDSGLRACLSHGIIEQGDSEKRKRELEVSKSFVRDFDGAFDGRIRTMFGPHSTYTCSPECLSEVRKLASDFGVGAHIHVAENDSEVSDVLDSRGKRPLELLESLGFLGEDVLAAHCTRLSEEEIDMVEGYGVSPVHNPVSNMKLGSGIAPVQELLSRGVPVALGTDGAASNNSLDLLEEMKFGALLSKVGELDSTVTPAEKVLEMCTINGAKALGWEEEIGSLEVGKKADLILIDLNKPHLTPLNSLESNIVYSCNGSDVSTVIVDGNILMEDRNVKTINLDDAIKGCESSIEKIESRLD